ncbi:Fe-Mn family superoxide dismutase [Anoxybacillus tepidamans]|uniref:superoxide dismutase n=1 Tax=Anoxybacteroides tepidamans TaxID=265948 RepID=A0A7W8IN46_9BACL|nr:superoxide dismutase [Anoxybacillus tepidamans]MBB5323479.1 Fe-Mn family superoxide dismutase [Anoxybacillus tepidamans]
MEQQAQFQQYVHEVMEWGKQLREEGSADVEELLVRLKQHEGEWSEEEIYDIQMTVDVLYEKAMQLFQERNEQMTGQTEESTSEKVEWQTQFQQYVHEVTEWGKQLAQQSGARGEVEDFLVRLAQHEGEWTEEAICEIQGMADALYERALQLYQTEEELEEKTADVTDEAIDEEMLRQEHDRISAGGHTLPPLPYRYDALEPHISGEMMQLHHTKHHQSYVDGLNKAEKMMQKARETNDYELLTHWEREAAFHGSGHYLHTIFWYNMTPKGGGEPQGALLEQIKADFGSIARFKQHFTEAAKKVEGVGWALLVWSPRAHRLEILQTEKHQFMTQWDTIPLLVLDVWEHAYYLQYKNDRAAYINSWWNVVNWRDVERRFEQASKLRWKAF